MFESNKQEDANGLITIKTIKKMAAYHQYYAVNAAVLSTIRASAVNSDSEIELAMQHQGSKLELVQQQAVGDKKAGVVWHTQGSKSGVLHRQDCFGFGQSSCCHYRS